jgi:hypothetical protein
MESNLGQRRRGLEEKIPDMKNTLAVVEMLQQRKVNIYSIYWFNFYVIECPAVLTRASHAGERGDRTSQNNV